MAVSDCGKAIDVKAPQRWNELLPIEVIEFGKSIDFSELQ